MSVRKLSPTEADWGDHKTKWNDKSCCCFYFFRLKNFGVKSINQWNKNGAEWLLTNRSIQFSVDTLDRLENNSQRPMPLEQLQQTTDLMLLYNSEKRQKGNVRWWWWYQWQPLSRMWWCQLVISCSRRCSGLARRRREEKQAQAVPRQVSALLCVSSKKKETHWRKKRR